ncbi:MAG TPA: rhodanese-like domain-containing protein [Planctomycetota bacterium]|nr:rhodanese-like domain-containing protein [Planctomycetota bacterium]
MKAIPSLRSSARFAAWWLALYVACGGGELDWPSVKAGVREEFPHVRSVSVAELQRRLEGPVDSRPVLLDARSSEEFEVSHLQDAIHVPSKEEALAALSNTRKGDPVLVYCSVGYRSASLAQQLSAHGFTNVANVEGSIFEWANSGLPVYRGALRVHEVHPYDARWGRLLRRDLWSHDP